MKWLACPCIGPRPAFWKNSCDTGGLVSNGKILLDRVGMADPAIGFIIFLRTVRIRHLVLGVVLVDQVLQDRTALKHSDGRPIGELVR